MLSAFDPSTPTGAVVLNILAKIGAVAILAVLGWLIWPLKWLIQNRLLRKIILSKRDFRFVYNPESNKSKTITFLPDGQIGEGRNSNENSWLIRHGKLEIIAADGKWYSRFKQDKETGNLINTNSPGTRSVHGQYFVPQWKRLSPNSGTKN